MPRSFRPTAALRALLRSPPRGVSAVEFGLAAPILLFLVVGLVDLGLGFYEKLQVRHAVSAGAQYAMVHGWDQLGIIAAVRGATNLDITFPPGSASEVCACPLGTGGSADSDLQVLGNAVGGSCSSYGTCSTCTTWDGKACPAGRYAFVSGQVQYSPILPYPWMSPPLTLSSDAYGRME